MNFTYEVATTHVLDELGVPKSFQNEIEDNFFGYPKIAYNLEKRIAIIPEVSNPFVLPNHSFVLFINDYSFLISVVGAAEPDNMVVEVFANEDLLLFNDFSLVEIVRRGLNYIKDVRLPIENILVRKPRSEFNCVVRTTEEIIEYVNLISEKVSFYEEDDVYSLLLSLIRVSEQVRFVELGDRTNWIGLTEKAREIFESTFTQVANKLRAT